MKKTALILGALGQDGSYLTNFLIKKNYFIYALDKNIKKKKWKHKYLNIKSNVQYIDINFSNFLKLNRIIENINPDEIYNLASQSSSKLSEKIKKKTYKINYLLVQNILEKIILKNHKIKYFQASSSEIFGYTKNKIQHEKTTPKPLNPYGIYKLKAHKLVIEKRNKNQLFLCNGILFNHESPLRKDTFVTKKIIKQLVEYKYQRRKKIFLGNIHSKRDWGYAGDYVEAMWLILQQNRSDDFIVSSNKVYSVKEFIDIVLKKLNIYGKWILNGSKFCYIEEKTKKNIIVSSASVDKRKKTINYRRGNNSKIINKIKWIPKVNLNKLVDIMILFEKNNLKKIAR